MENFFFGYVMLVHGKICGYDFGRVGIFFFFFWVHGHVGIFFLMATFKM